MTLLFCMDDNGGMMFGGRRQSRDSKVLEDVLNACKGSSLYINVYSDPIFDGLDTQRNTINVVTSLSGVNFKENDFCFVENESPALLETMANKIVIYKWNRDYPFDKTVDIDLKQKWNIVSCKNFVGTSHEKITREEYVRK